MSEKINPDKFARKIDQNSVNEKLNTILRGFYLGEIPVSGKAQELKRQDELLRRVEAKQIKIEIVTISLLILFGIFHVVQVNNAKKESDKTLKELETIHHIPNSLTIKPQSNQ